MALLEKAGQKVLFKKIIADDETMIQDAVMYAMGLSALDVAIFSGGTGITPTDITIETVSPFFEKTLPGFGEFFRRISFDKIGSSCSFVPCCRRCCKGQSTLLHSRFA